MSDTEYFTPQSVFCRKHGNRIAVCKPGTQAWYQNGSTSRTQVFAVEIDGPPVWVNGDELLRLKRGSKVIGQVFTTRRGFTRAEPYEGRIGYQQLRNGARVRVIHTEDRWIRERYIDLQFVETASFVLPVVDQTAE